MKLWLFMGLSLLIFSGCSTKTQNHRLRMMNAKQANIIKQQQSQINALNAKLKLRQIAKQKAKQQTKQIQTKRNQSTSSAQNITAKPKKNIVLKKVEDTNYSSQYMYPDANKKVPSASAIKKVPSSSPTTSNVMTKAECISMIGQDKFDKYTRMFGNETASLKRCRMLKTMKQ